MAINTTTFESSLQTKLDDTTLVAKDMLLLGKALEATTGNIAVSDINTAAATKVSEINTAATNTFKTVGGASILGTGDIAALPAGGTVGQVVTNTGSGAGDWADAGGGAWSIKQKGTFTNSTQLTFNAFTKTTKIMVEYTHPGVSVNIIFGANTDGSGSPGSNMNIAAHGSSGGGPNSNSNSQTTNTYPFVLTDGYGGYSNVLEVIIYDPTNTTKWTKFRTSSQGHRDAISPKCLFRDGIGSYQDTAALNTLFLTPSAYSLTGTYTIWELN